MKRNQVFPTLLLIGSLFILLSNSCTKSEQAPKPVAAFSWQSQSTAAPATVTFTNTSTNASTYLWDFGDGNTSTSMNPTNRYATGGNFVVKLTATGAGGVNTISQTISLLNPTALQISVKDKVGNPVSGATVKLYSSFADWTNQTNQVLTTQTTNATGVVIFSPLSPATYYWQVVSGCQTNFLGSIYNVNPLQANITNQATVIIEGTGVLALNNSSSNLYDVYVNGNLQITNMAGGSTRNIIAPIGNHIIRVVQKSGCTIFSCNDKTYNVTLNCGATITTTFP